MQSILLVSSQTSVQKQELHAVGEQAQNVAIHLKLHERARVLYTDFNQRPENIASTNLATVIASTDLVILKFLTTMTQFAQQSRQNLFRSRYMHMHVFGRANLNLTGLQLYELVILTYNSYMDLHLARMVQEVATGP